MTPEEMILARLESIEGELQFLRKSSESAAELRKDLAPLFNSAFRILMEELGDVEFGFQLEDFFVLLKRGLRSIRNITYALEQLENLIDLWNAMEPMLKSTVPNLIDYLDNLERKGVFRTYKAMLEVRAKVAAHYGPEEITDMGDGFVLFLGFLKKLSNPEMIQFLNQLLDIPLELRLEEVKPLGPLGALAGLGSKEVRQGLGVMLELTKAVGKLKQGNGGRV
ncbi:MAG: DUF1641 domain-containing protein [Deltaproteobacteria bacterium]|nr:DUF1641 domain-containing protein [Deltaproteobacteria bacterium]